jgi:serine/threonine protein kinase
VKEHHKKILKKEVDVLRELCHPNIVRMIEDLDDGKNLVIVLEYLKGGGLLEHLFEVEHYTEAQAAYLFQQMLQAVEYMHSSSIMHRDIKPENIVFEKPVSGVRRHEKPVVKLVDFGLARIYSSSRSVKARLGSPGFMAPEVRLLFFFGLLFSGSRLGTAVQRRSHATMDDRKT